MPRKPLRFPLNAADQSRIEPGKTIEVLDGAPSFPDWVNANFSVDAVGGAPRLRFLCPGTLTFLADPNAEGKLPDPTDPFDWTEEQYKTWRTLGTLVLLVDAAFASRLEALAAPRPAPRAIWYWPARVTQDFLFDSVRKQNKQRVSRVPAGFVDVRDPRWEAHAVAGFLRGTYPFKLTMHATDPDQDDCVRFPMPALDMDPDGGVALWIAMAARSTLDDGQAAALAAEVPPDTNPLDATHPGNPMLNARELLTRLRAEMIDAEDEEAKRLARALLAPWPAGPRYFPIQVSVPGTAKLFSGLLPGETVKVHTFDETLLQERRLPSHGLLTITQPAPPPAGPPPAPLAVEVSVAGGLVITETNGSLPLSTEALFDFSVVGDRARLTLQPTGPDATDPAQKSQYSRRLASVCFNLGKAPATQDAVATALRADEALIRPSTWTAADLIFRGTRFPWRGTLESDLVAVFDGLQTIALTAPDLPPIRPGDAMLLWLMEGKVTAQEDELLPGGHPGPLSLRSPTTAGWLDFDTLASGHSFSAAEISGASPSSIQVIARTKLLWVYWGLDIMNKWAPPPNPDHAPLLSGPLADAVKQHNDRMDTALQKIIDAGIVPPTRLAVTDAIEVRKDGAGDWIFRPRPSYRATCIALQYAEYLRRLSRLPADARPSAAFGYIAYNGGFQDENWNDDPTKPFWVLWNDADWRLHNDPALAGKTHDDALRSYPMTADEIAKTPRANPDQRSLAARVNGLHYAALAGSYGAVFPRVLYP